MRISSNSLLHLTEKKVQTMTSLFYVEIQTPDHAVRNIQLDHPERMIGRNHQSCNILVSDDKVSRIHMKLSQREDGRWMLVDLDSKNGTLVDGIRIQPAQPVAWQLGQTVVIGDTRLVLLPADDFIGEQRPESAASGFKIKSLAAYNSQTTINKSGPAYDVAYKNPDGTELGFAPNTNLEDADTITLADKKSVFPIEKKRPVWQGYIGIDDQTAASKNGVSDPKGNWIGIDQPLDQNLIRQSFSQKESRKSVNSISPRLLFDIIDRLLIISVEEINAQYLRCAFEDWYHQRKDQYIGKPFLSQFEQHTVSFIETTYLGRNYLVDYLISGDVNISAKTIPSHIVVKPLIAFLKGDSVEKPPQVSNLDYFQLRDLRQSSDRRGYHKTLSRICYLYYPAMEIMCRALTMSLASPQLARVASILPHYQISETLIERALFHTKRAVGLPMRSSDHNTKSLELNL